VTPASRPIAAREVDALGPSTIQPVAVSKRVPLELRGEILQALTSMHEDPVARERLALGMVKRFVPVGPPPTTTSA
jgi:phosphonate transport system substrate-binding protein